MVLLTHKLTINGLAFVMTFDSVVDVKKIKDNYVCQFLDTK